MVKVAIVVALQVASLAAISGLAVGAPEVSRPAPPPGFPDVISIPGTSELTSVSCVGTSVCVAAGQGTTSGGKTTRGSLPTDAVAVSFSPAGHPSGTTVGHVTSLAQNVSVRDVVCVSPTRCEVLGNTHTRSEVVAFDPATDAVARPVVLPNFLGSAGALGWAGAMACPTSSRCLIVGGSSSLSPSSTPKGEAVVFDPLDGKLGAHASTGVDAVSISCPTTAVCELAGYTSRGAVFARLQPASLRVTGAVWSDVSGLYTLSCASVHACDAVGFASYANGGHYGALVSVDPVSGVVGLFQRTTDALVGISCLSATVAPTTTCELFGSNSQGSGDVMPVMDGILEGANAIPGSTLLQAGSCPASTLCVRVGASGQPYQGSGEGVLSVQQVALTSGNTNAACPGSGTTTDKPLRHPTSRFDDITDNRPGGFGGVYAHISFAPACRDAKSDPATSSWVMLQAGRTQYAGCRHRSLVFVQAGIFYSSPASKANSEHAFAEVDYPCLKGNGSHEFDQAVSSGTFGVEDLGQSTSHANCPGLTGKAAGDRTDNVVDRVEATLNGRCLWVMDLPAKYAGRMSWANLSGEVHTSTALVPGDYQYPLTFTKAHVYFDGGWQNFTSNKSGRAGNPTSAPGQTVVDAARHGGQGCQLSAPVGGANWAVYMWSVDEGQPCNPYSG